VTLVSIPLALPPLPYPYGAPEPTIDELTMRIHHDKHHGGYVAALNTAVRSRFSASGRVIGRSYHRFANPFGFENLAM
jgi:superoxide dismutase